MRKVWWLGVYTVAAILIGVGCADQDRGMRDAPINTNLQDNQAPYVVNFSDDFHNLELKCAVRDLLITHTRTAPPVVVKDSSVCEPGVAESMGVPRVNHVEPKAG